jgi:hypothetical protein
MTNVGILGVAVGKDRKVIPFTGKYKKPPGYKQEELRKATTIGLVFMMFMMMAFNFSMFEAKLFQKDESASVLRGIASVPKAFEPQWKKNLSEINDKMISESARKPTAVENLNFGVLEGKYTLKVLDGHVIQIDFAKLENREPHLLQDRSRFVSEYASAFMVGFRFIDRLATIKDAEGTKETFRVRSDKGESIFEFHLDPQDRFVSLSVK